MKKHDDLHWDFLCRLLHSASELRRDKVILNGQYSIYIFHIPTACIVIFGIARNLQVIMFLLFSISASDGRS